jgi:Concanavalin A-like lectin/glucanases superfamily/Glycosyl hydrolase family 20, catalytic domain/Glycosyl hydrolase family 20, domain 2
MMLKKWSVGLFAVMVLAVNFSFAKMVDEWKFDASFKNSVSSTKMKVIGSPQWSDDRFLLLNKALELDGSDDYLMAKVFNVYQKNAEFTLEMWLKLGKSGIQGILQHPSFVIRAEKNNSLRLISWDKDSKKMRRSGSGSPLDIDKWYHLAVTLNKSTITMFVNGKRAGKKLEMGSLKDTTSPLMVIGRFSKKFMKGALDDIKVYDNALSPEEIYANYSANKLGAVKVGVKLLDNRSVLYLPLTTAKITVDGRFTEKAWNKIPWQQGFKNNKTGKPAIHQTKFKVLRKAEGLYFAIRADGGQGKATVKPAGNTGRMFYSVKDDVVEIHFTPKGFAVKDGFRQFAFNALGACADLHSRAETLSPWIAKIRRDAGGYSAEIFIPNEVINFDNTTITGFNVCRISNITAKRDVSSWSGIKGRFNQYEQFGMIVPGKKITDGFVLSNGKNVNNSIEFNLKSTPGTAIMGWIHYFAGKKIGYKIEQLSLKNGVNKIDLAKCPAMIGGRHFITVTASNDDRGLNDLKIFEFYSAEKKIQRTVSYKQPQLIPAVKKAKWQTGIFPYKDISKIIYYPTPNGYEQKTAEKIKKCLAPYGVKISAIIRGDKKNPPPNAIVVGSLKNRDFIAMLKLFSNSTAVALKKIPVKAQGYVLELQPDNIALLAGQDGAGAYYAFRTLLQIIKFDPDKVTTCSILDWPDLARRGITDVIGMNILNNEQLSSKYLFEIVAGFKYNEIIVRAMNGFDFSNPKVGGNRILKKDFIRKMVRYAKENFIKIIPIMETHGSSEWLYDGYPEMFVFPERFKPTKRSQRGNKHIYVGHPNFYKVLFPLMKEVYEVFDHPESFHIGHDELGHYGIQDPKVLNELHNLTVNDILKQEKYLKSLGVKNVIMWADILIEDFNGGPPLNYAKLRSRIPKNSLTLMHWIGYNSKSGMEQALVDYGFKNLIFSSNRADITGDLPKNPAKFKAFYANRFGSPAPWHTFPEKFSNSVGRFNMRYQYPALAHDSDLFWNIKRKKQLNYAQFITKYGNALMRITAGRRHGSSLKYRPLKLSDNSAALKKWQLPLGKLNLASLAGTIDKSAYRNIPSKNSTILNQHKKKAKIAVNSKARAVAVIHTANFNHKSVKKYIKDKINWFSIGHGERTSRKIERATRDALDGPIVAEYILQYQDGTEYKTTVKHGYNIYIWNAEEFTSLKYLLYDASEIWDIDCDKGKTASVQVMVIDNPHLEKIIKSITLNKKEPAVDIAICGIGIAK